MSDPGVCVCVCVCVVGIGWRAEVHPRTHPVNELEFDVIIGADGRRNTLAGNKRTHTRADSHINSYKQTHTRTHAHTNIPVIFTGNMCCSPVLCVNGNGIACMHLLVGPVNWHDL